VLEALPTGTATRDGVVEAHATVGQAFVEHARPAVDTLGGRWPDELEVATRKYLHAHGVTT
jgi:hypothetical protein